MPSGSGVVEFDLYFRRVILMARAESNLWGVYDVRFFIDLLDRGLCVDAFDRGPCFYVRICRVGVIVVVIVIVPVVTIAASAASVVIAAIAIVPVTVRVITVIISPAGRALTFFVAALGPAFGSVMPFSVAIETFDFRSVFLPSVGCECFLRAVLAQSLFDYAPIVFIAYEAVYYIGGNVSTA
jgi:hypothetical protein